MPKYNAPIKIETTKCIKNRIAVSDRSRDCIKNVRISNNPSCRQNVVAYVSLRRQHLLVSILITCWLFLRFFGTDVKSPVCPSNSGVNGGWLHWASIGALTGVIRPDAVIFSVDETSITIMIWFYNSRVLRILVIIPARSKAKFSAVLCFFFRYITSLPFFVFSTNRSFWRP